MEQEYAFSNLLFYHDEEQGRGGLKIRVWRRAQKLFWSARKRMFEKQDCIQTEMILRQFLPSIQQK